MKEEYENQSLTTALKGIMEIVDNPGIINIDLSEIIHFINTHTSLAMGFGEGCGEFRVTEAVQGALNMLFSPRSDQDLSIINFLFDAPDAIVYFFFEKKDMTIYEVATAVDEIRLQLKGTRPGKLIWGMGKKEFLDDKLQIIILKGDKINLKSE